MRYWRLLIAALVAGVSGCQDAHFGGPFGGASAMDHSLKGDIYRLPPGAARLPDFRSLKPVLSVQRQLVLCGRRSMARAKRVRLDGDACVRPVDAARDCCGP